LEPACRATQVWVVHIQYALADGSPGDEIAYWGEATLVPHLLNLLTKREIRAEIRCERAPVTTANRKQLARELHARVCRLGTTEPAPGG
jgi:hypothetical protein